MTEAQFLEDLAAEFGKEIADAAWEAYKDYPVGWHYKTGLILARCRKLKAR